MGFVVGRSDFFDLDFRLSSLILLYMATPLSVVAMPIKLVVLPISPSITFIVRTASFDDLQFAT